MNRRRRFLAALAASSIAIASGANGQTQRAMARIGYLAETSPDATPDLLKSFREGLREHGYTEGQNLSIEYRWTEGTVQGLPELAAELVRLKVDLILAWATPAALAAKHATSTLPVVMVGLSDPVASGLVASLARPGGNITGVSNLSSDLSPKLVELLIQVVPKINRFTAIRDASNPSSASALNQIDAAAGSLGLKLELVDVRTPEDLDVAFASMNRAPALGVVVLPDPMFIGQRQKIADLSMNNRLPTVFARRENVEAGGLMSYGPDLRDQFRKAAGYAARILNGANPAQLPVELPTKFELVINLKTAKALGLTIPQSLLLRADEVIQ